MLAAKVANAGPKAATKAQPNRGLTSRQSETSAERTSSERAGPATAAHELAWDLGTLPIFDPDRLDDGEPHTVMHPAAPRSFLVLQRAVSPDSGAQTAEADRPACPVCGKQHPSGPANQISRKCDACEEESRQTLQAKLMISNPGDLFEHEADRMAEHVRRAGAVASVGPPVPTPLGVGASDTGLRVGCDVQARVQQVVASPGHALDASTRRIMEAHFGFDFGHVRIHADPVAQRSARDLGALAYTTGNHVVFAPRQYNPSSQAGLGLLAHELTHVVQQSASSAPRIIARQPDNAADACEKGHPRGEPLEFTGVPQADTKIYRIWGTWAAGDSATAFVHRALTEWLQWRFGAISAQQFTAARELLLKAFYSLSGQSQPAGCQSYIVVQYRVMAELRRLTGEADREKQAAKDRAGAAAKEAQGQGNGPPGQAPEDKGSGDGASKDNNKAGRPSLVTGVVSTRGNAPIVPEEVPTIGITAARDQDAKIPHERAETVHANLRIFDKNPILSTHYLQALEHFTGRDITASDKTNAAIGLTEAQVQAIAAERPSVKMLTYVYTQGWQEFQKAGGTDVQAFFLLEEALLEQLARGNPTAAGNKLQIGQGQLPDAGKVLGIVDRGSEYLLYDDSGSPLPAVSGIGFRDHGYVGSRVKPDGGVLDSFGLNIARIEDPGLRAFLNSLRMTFGDPTRVTLQAADFIFRNIEVLKDDILRQVPAKVLEGLKDSLKYFVGFLVGEAVSGFMLRSLNPTVAGIGLAVKALLKAAEYVMNIDFVGSVTERLNAAGKHLVRVEQKPDKTFTALSARHLQAAKAPIVQLLTEIGVMGVMVAGSKVASIIGKLRLGGKGEIKCTICSLDSKTETEADDDNPYDEPDEAPKSKPADPRAGEPKVQAVTPDPAKVEPPEAIPAKPDTAKADPAKPDEAAPDTAKQDSPEVRLEKARARKESVREQIDGLKRLQQLYEGAKKAIEALRNRLIVERTPSPETSAKLRDAKAQVDAVTQTLEAKFGIKPELIQAKLTKLISDFVQATKEFLPLDVRLNPKKNRAVLPCFAAGTIVLTPAGPRAIETLAEGDQVIGFDFTAGLATKARISGLLRGWTNAFTLIGVEGQTIRATSLHPFWAVDHEGWVEARDLVVGMRLSSASGRPIAIQSISVESLPDTQTFNLNVEGLSTYHVGPGVLVHNEGTDAGFGGSYMIYRLTNPNLANKVYIGQTTTQTKSGKPRGATARREEHVQEAEAELEVIDQQLAKKPPPEERVRLEKLKAFFDFKKGAVIEVLVYGIANQAQADWLEQLNIDLEKQLVGEDNVVNRRDQISTQRLAEARAEIVKDPRVTCP